MIIQKASSNLDITTDRLEVQTRPFQLELSSLSVSMPLLLAVLLYYQQGGNRCYLITLISSSGLTLISPDKLFLAQLPSLCCTCLSYLHNKLRSVRITGLPPELKAHHL